MYISTLCNGISRLYSISLIFLFLCNICLGNNIEEGGAVGIDQTICIGESPSIIFDISPASGGDNNLAVEYLWMKSVPGVSEWEAIEGATEATYSPGVLQRTTAFIRCARRAGFTNYTGESNVILITVLEGPIVVINSPRPEGVDNSEPINFTGFSSLSYANLTWDFGDGNTAIGTDVTHKFDFGGDKIVKLTATNPFNGCSSTITIEFFLLGPLPVELNYFYGEQVDNRYVELQWSTTQEEINSHFEVEKSIDGNRFETIGAIAGSGTTNETQFYSFKDEIPLPGINYYRLKQIDFDGEFTFSDVIALKVDKESKLEYTLYPNPTVEELNIRFLDVFEAEMTLYIKDVNNRIIKKEKVAPASLKHTLDVSDLQSGVYNITLWSRNIRSSAFFVKTGF